MPRVILRSMPVMPSALLATVLTSIFFLFEPGPAFGDPISQPARLHTQHKSVIHFKPNLLVGGYTYANAGHAKLIYITQGSNVELWSPNCNSVGWKATPGRERKRTSTYVMTAWGYYPYDLDCEVDAIWNPHASQYYYDILYIHIEGSAHMNLRRAPSMRNSILQPGAFR